MVAGLLTLPALLLSTGTASADNAKSDVLPDYSKIDESKLITHPELDTMGSTIAKHEGVQRGAHPQVQAGVPGIDVSHYQGNIDWGAVAGSNRFAYMKATEGTSYIDPQFSANYGGSYNAGMIRGAYHFARPDASGGVAQAQYFVAHGGGWSADGKTLPPMLDIEYGPNSTCYGIGTAAMSQWIADFSNEVQRLTSRYPVIYTTTNWWNECTGGNAGFGAANPLFMARYASDPGPVPPGWGTYTFWQYSSTGSVPGIAGNVDVDTFNGAEDRLLALANNTP